MSWPAQIVSNIGATFATLLRAPRRALPWPGCGRLLLGAVIAILVILAVMALIDPWSLARVKSLPPALVLFFHRITDAGLGGWFLWPTGIALIVLAIIDRPSLPRAVQGTLAALAVRVGFVFAALALPGLFITASKHVIGRARPFVEGMNVWAYKMMTWPAAYASMPSGHATTVFSALVAIGALWPSMRPIMWVYALLIAASRIAIYAHHPSDVLAGALVGTVGALLVRHWFAARRLGFKVGDSGRIEPMAGPSFKRIKRVAARLAAA